VALSEETTIEAFKNGEDIHASTASKVFKTIDRSDLRTTKQCKKTVYSELFMEYPAFGLSNRSDMSRGEAKVD
jgi:DNA polymerase-1